MASTTVALSRAVPRDPAILQQLDLKAGLRVGLTFCWLFYGVALLAPIIAIAGLVPSGGPRCWLGLMGPLLFGALGSALYLPARRRLRARVQAFTHGHIVLAAVSAHDRAFVVYKSWRDYVVHLRYPLPEGGVIFGKVQSAGSEFQDAWPIGTQVTCLYDQSSGTLLCPAELGVNVTAAD